MVQSWIFISEIKGDGFLFEDEEEEEEEEEEKKGSWKQRFSKGLLEDHL